MYALSEIQSQAPEKYWRPGYHGNWMLCLAFGMPLSDRHPDLAQSDISAKTYRSVFRAELVHTALPCRTPAIEQKWLAEGTCTEIITLQCHTIAQLQASMVHRNTPSHVLARPVTDLASGKNDRSHGAQQWQIVVITGRKTSTMEPGGNGGQAGGLG